MPVVHSLSARDALPMKLERIVSGGQTGADRGGLDAAIALGIPHGGWCPKGRRAEDGAVPTTYQLTETKSANYQDRTKRNVLESDATVIFTRGALTGGSLLTAKTAGAAGKPMLHIDLDRLGDTVASDRLRQWITQRGVRVLNVAGSRESRVPGINDAVRRCLSAALRDHCAAIDLGDRK